MSQQTAAPTQARSPAPAPAAGLLQRQYACGQHTIAGGECAECRQKRLALQRRATNPADPPAVPPLDPATRAFTEPRFGQDFSRIPARTRVAGVIQTKLAINQPGDEYEQEADRIADQVMAAPAYHPVSNAPPRIQRFVGQPTGQVETAPASVDQVLASPGRPLEPELRQDMEQRFGYDFSPVRVHTGAVAEQSAQDISAYAYTAGHDIVFGASKFEGGTHEGRRLLAHELTHVVQQLGTGGVHIRKSHKKGGLYPIPLLPQSHFPVRIQRQPSNGVCTSVTIHLPNSITFEGTKGPIKASVELKGGLQPGTYKISWDATKGELFVDTPKGDFMKVSGKSKGDKKQRAAEEARFNAYVRSLSKPVTLTVIDSRGGSGGGSGGSGTGQAGKPSPTEGHAGETKKPGDEKEGGKKGGVPGGTGDKGKKTETSGGPGGETKGGEKTSPEYADKLKALLDGTENKPLDPKISEQLKTILDKMSLDDIALFKQVSVKKTGGGEDMEGFLRSLRLFLSTKEEFEKARSSQAKTQFPGESAKILTDAMKQYRDDMSQDEKERLARASIRSLSNEQLKNLTPQQIAESIVRVDKQLAGMADDMDKGVNDLIRGTGWEKVAGGARAVKGAASFWGFLAMAAIVASAFIPGLNVAVLAAHAFAAGLVAYAAANIQLEAEIKAAGHAKSPEDFQKYLINGTAARTEVIVGGVVLALPLVGKFIGKLPVPAALNRVSTVLNTAGKTLKQTSGKAFGSVKASALEALSSARANMQPYLIQFRATVGSIAGRLRRANGAEFLKEVKNTPELQELVPAETLKAMGQLSADELAIAKKGVIEQLDNAPALAEETIKNMQAQMADLEKKVQAAKTAQDLEKVLGEGSKTTEFEPMVQAAGKQAVGNVVQARVKKISDLTLTDVIDDTKSLMQDVQNLPNTNPNRQPVLNELKDILKKTQELEKKQGKADISKELEDISRRHEELDDLVADAVAAVNQNRRPAVAPPPQKAAPPPSNSGKQPPELPRGKLREAEVAEAYNLGPKNNLTMKNPDPTKPDFIPDHIEGNPTSLKWGKPYHFKEIKDWADMSDTGNLSAMLDYIENTNGSKLTIYYKSNTYMSGPLKSRIERLVTAKKVTLIPFLSE